MKLNSQYVAVLTDFGDYWRYFDQNLHQQIQSSERIHFETTLLNTMTLFHHLDQYIDTLKEKIRSTDTRINVLYLVFGIGTILLVSLQKSLLWLSYRRGTKQTY